MTHGCHSRQPFKDWHHAQDGYWPMSKPEAGTRLPRIVQIPHVMTRECQFTKHNPNDAGCAGCKHQKPWGCGPATYRGGVNEIQT